MSAYPLSSLAPVPPPARTLRMVNAARAAEDTAVVPRQHAAKADTKRPAWIRHGAHHVVDEFKLYFRTIWDFTCAPKATAAAWAAGEYKAINPLNLFLKSFAVVAPWHAYWWAKLGHNRDFGSGSLGAAFSAYGFLILITLAHPFFRLVQAKGGISGTWAAGLYVLGGLPTFASLVIEPLTLWSRAALRGHSSYSWNVPGMHIIYAPGASITQYNAIVAAVVVYLAYWFYLGSVLAGVHGISRRRIFASFFGSIATVAFLLILFAPLLNHFGVIQIRTL